MRQYTLTRALLEQKLKLTPEELRQTVRDAFKSGFTLGQIEARGGTA